MVDGSVGLHWNFDILRMLAQKSYHEAQLALGVQSKANCPLTDARVWSRTLCQIKIVFFETRLLHKRKSDSLLTVQMTDPAGRSASTLSRQSPTPAQPQSQMSCVLRSGNHSN